MQSLTLYFGLFVLSQSGTASSHLIQCQNSSCSNHFHTFCQNPPLIDVTDTSDCSLCKVSEITLASSEEEHAKKRIEKIVGHRTTIQECNFQYEFLVKWHSLSHHYDCWVCIVPLCHYIFLENRS